MNNRFVSAFMIATAFCASTISVYAQGIDRDTAIAKMQDNVEATSARLNLTEEQKPEVEAILRDSAEQRLAIFKSFGFEEGNRPNLRMRQKLDLRNQLQSLSEQTSTRLSAVLSAEQMAEYELIQEEQREAMRAMLEDK